MKTVTVDLTLLRKYFSEFYDFDTNFGLYFSRGRYDIETDLYQKEYLEQYDQISNICRDYGLLEFTDIFFNLFFISWQVKILKSKISHKYGYIPNIEYKNQLFNLFRLAYQQLISGEAMNRIESIDFHYCPTDAKTLRITDKILSEQIQRFIIDQVCNFLKSKPYSELSDLERGEVLTTVNHWFITSKDIQKGGAPNKAYFLKSFAANILRFIDNETPLASHLKTEKYEFIGKLFEVYDLKKSTRQTGYFKMISNILNIKG